MTPHLMVVADPETTGCCAPPADGDRVVVANAPLAEQADTLIVRLGGQETLAGVTVWWTYEGQQLVDGAATHTAPWPAADDLYDLPLPEAGVVLVVGTGDRAANVAGGLTVRDVEGVVLASALRREDLARARTVLVIGDAPQAIVTVAMPTLAARRVLIAPRTERPFGLLAGIDYLAYESDAEAVQFGDAAASWDSFDFMRAAGAEAAYAHRASQVFERILRDQALLSRSSRRRRTLP